MAFVTGFGIPNLDFLYGGMPRLPKEGEEIYAQCFDVQLGGGVPATMINLRRLGVPVKFSTFLGQDQFSAMVESALQQNGVEYANLYQGTSMPITVTTAIITPADRTFVSYRDATTITPAMHEQVYQQSRGAKLVYMHMPFLKVYQRLKAEYPDTIFTFDVGWDDSLCMDMVRDYLELADYFTPNQKEALKITNTHTPQAAANVLEQYLDHVIVKLDCGGCLIQEQGKLQVLPILPNVQAVDATGAGDAFMSGLLYGLYHNYPFADCVRFGNVMGGYCVQAVGCLTCAPTEHQLHEGLRLLQSMQQLTV